MKAWFVLLILAIAGCAEPSSENVVAPEPTIENDPQNATINPTAWQVGDWFGHHIFFGAADTEGYHINVMIDRETDQDWHFVTDDEEIARFEEVLDIPITGDIAKADLDTTAFGGASEIYDFPLFDGKTWTGEVQFDFFDSYDLTFTAMYEEDVTPFGDGRPGFAIEGRLADGTVVLETDYDPSFGWYNNYVVYNETGPGEDFLFRSIHMGWGHNWTGTAYEYDSSELLNDAGQVIVPAGEVEGATHLTSINVREESTHLMALQYCFAVVGASDARLRAPSGESYDCQSTHLPDGADPNGWGGEGDGDFFEIPHEIGTWNYLRASAGFVAGGGLQLWELTEQEIVFQS